MCTKVGVPIPRNGSHDGDHKQGNYGFVMIPDGLSGNDTLFLSNLYSVDYYIK